MAGYMKMPTQWAFPTVSLHADCSSLRNLLADTRPPVPLSTTAIAPVRFAVKQTASRSMSNGSCYLMTIRWRTATPWSVARTAVSFSPIPSSITRSSMHFTRTSPNTKTTWPARGAAGPPGTRTGSARRHSQSARCWIGAHACSTSAAANGGLLVELHEWGSSGAGGCRSFTGVRPPHGSAWIRSRASMPSGPTREPWKFRLHGP